MVLATESVSRNDTLSRSGSPPKPLASIAELEPFFEERRQRKPSVPDGLYVIIGGLSVLNVVLAVFW